MGSHLHRCPSGIHCLIISTSCYICIQQASPFFSPRRLRVAGLQSGRRLFADTAAKTSVSLANPQGS